MRKTPEAWIKIAVAVMGDGGVEAVRVEPLAKMLGVTKGSFYWHFADRAALLQAVLKTWEKAGTDDVIEQVGDHRGDARARLLYLWKVVTEGTELNAELGIREWARREPAVARVVQRVDDRRMLFVRQLFKALDIPAAEVEARSLLLYSLLIGNHFIAAKHGRRTRGRVLKDAVEHLMR